MQDTILNWAIQKGQLFYDSTTWPLDKLITEQEFDDGIANGRQVVWYERTDPQPNDWNRANIQDRVDTLNYIGAPLTGENLLNGHISENTPLEDILNGL